MAGPQGHLAILPGQCVGGGLSASFFVYTFARAMLHFCLELTMATEKQAEKLTKAERDVIAEGLELLMKSHQRAANSQKGAIAAAHEAARDTVYALLNKVKTGNLEL